MTTEVADAVHEIRQTFAGHNVEIEEESQGGACVTVHDLEVGERYRPHRIWLGFLIPFQYPATDVYPHFTDPGLTWSDGVSLGEGFSVASWKGRPAMQISRRSNRWNPANDSAAAKLLKVLDWMKSR